MEYVSAVYVLIDIVEYKDACKPSERLQQAEGTRTDDINSALITLKKRKEIPHCLSLTAFLPGKNIMIEWRVLMSKLGLWNASTVFVLMDLVLDNEINGFRHVYNTWYAY